MLLIRPLTFADLQGLERLAIISGGSMTTLPANRDHLSELISKTQRSLKKILSAMAMKATTLPWKILSLAKLWVCAVLMPASA